jgi:hypothetical protein
MYGIGTPPLLLLPLLLPAPLLLPVPLLLPLAPLLLPLAVASPPPLLVPLLLPVLPPSPPPPPFVAVLPPHAHASAIAPLAAKSKRVFVLFMESYLPDPHPDSKAIHAGTARARLTAVASSLCNGEQKGVHRAPPTPRLSWRRAWRRPHA